MTHAIKIGQVLYEQLLTLDSGLGVGEKVFPIIAELDTTFPFTVYTRESISPNTMTKDGYVCDMVTFRIDVVADSYTNYIDIADAVRTLFERKQILSTNAALMLRNCHLVGMNESWDSNTYISQMRFECEVYDLPTQNTQQP